GLGAAARQARVHRDDRVVDVGQVAHRQQAVADDAEQQDPDHHQRGRDRTADEDLGEVHCRVPPPLAPPPAAPPPASRTSTFAPGPIRNCPSVTTVSPGLRPLAITASTSSERSTWTGRELVVESRLST